MDQRELLKRRTQHFALRIIRLCEALPVNPSARVIANQMLRSGTAIGANYRSACRARSKADFISKIGIVLEEADETVYWLDLLTEAGLINRHRVEDLRQEAEQLVAIFAASKRTAMSSARH